MEFGIPHPRLRGMPPLPTRQAVAKDQPPPATAVVFIAPMTQARFVFVALRSTPTERIARYRGSYRKICGTA